MKLVPSSRLQTLRIVVLAVLLLLVVPVGAQHALHEASDTGSVSRSAGTDAPSNVTVATIDATGPAQITAYHPNGSVLYRNTSFGVYHDVDPSPSGRMTVMYTATEFDVPSSACEASSCIRNVVERVNLTTGDVTRIHSMITPYVGSSQTHDVDRINDSVLLVGDIGPPDRVYMVNTTTDEIIWEWRVDAAYSHDSGGKYPGDWTHLNDVEYLHDGRVMVGLRNQDQVVFVRPGHGLISNWTLGCDDCHDVLYEQHNPDYIPTSDGGPAVLVADSENNRIVEYQRIDGEWNRTWAWADSRLQWPRDADRLPNGQTLIVDSHGNRILEVNQSGNVTWELAVPDGIYDAERLGTGDESANGQSARALNSSTTNIERNFLTLMVPNLVLHGALYALPGWVSPTGGAALVLGGAIVTVWLAIELIARVITMDYFS